MLKATVSGSFHRHMPAVYTAVGELRALGVDVLSPADPRVVDHLGEFLFVASDKLRSVKLVQDRHFEAIRHSDFLWVVCPDGYTGASTSAEIGAAHMIGTPVFSDTAPLDATLCHYVRKIPSIKSLVTAMAAKATPHRVRNYLLEPDQTIEESHIALDRMRFILNGGIKSSSDAVERELSGERRKLESFLGISKLEP